ncbi:MAG: hypothetical protein C0613_12545 [Desulfobulbaceae bacterium]|nr:MAG: hypothetical protein C0613_12545 [Desulfobulbaceae bacterium]
MAETVLVTGGTGIVGKPLVEGLLAQGKRVVVLSRQQLPCDLPAVPGRLSYLQGDVSMTRLGLDPQVYAELCAELTAIFHLAARTDFKGGSVADYAAVNIHGVKKVHALACQAGAHLHHVSTAFVCGTHDAMFGEDDLECGQDFRNGYEQSKFLAERFLHEQMARGQGRVTIYRPSIILERHPAAASVNTFGPFIFLDAVFRILLTAKMQDARELPLRLRGGRDCQLPFIFDNDVAAALLAIAASAHCLGRTYHLVCKNPCPNFLLEDVFNQAFGRKVAALVADDAFRQLPASQSERILARKTATYASYLDLAVSFARSNSEAVLGVDFCTEVTDEELLGAFSRFLVCKDENRDGGPIEERKRQDIDKYFTEFLPTIIGQQLIANLASLSCTFWLEVSGLPRRTLVIIDGCLQAITAGGESSFGYQVRPDIFLQVVSGCLSPQRAFFDGKITMAGNTMEALRTASALEEFFRYRPYLVKS